MRLLIFLLIVSLFPTAEAFAQAPAANVLEPDRPGVQAGAPSRRLTPHLTLTTFVTQETVAPGRRFSIVIDIAPKPGMHVYAPGKHDYRVVRLQLEPNATWRTFPMRHPKSVEYFFEPLNERVQVYEQPFRLTQDVAVVSNAETRKLARSPGATMTLKGVLEYQACTDKICFPPQEVPLTWTVALKD